MKETSEGQNNRRQDQSEDGWGDVLDCVSVAQIINMHVNPSMFLKQILVQ